MEKLTQSIENLKNIYLSEAQKEFTSDLTHDFSKSSDLAGFEKVPYWKLVAEKFVFVIQRKNPELSEVISVIIQEILEIIESGKQILHKERETTQAEIESLKKNLESSQTEIEKLRSELEKIRESERSLKDSLKDVEPASGQPFPADSRDVLENEAKPFDESGINEGLDTVSCKHCEVYKSQIQSLTSSLNESKSLVSSLVSQLQVLEQSSSSQSSTISKLQQENQDLIFQNNELQIELDDLKPKAKAETQKIVMNTPIIKPALKQPIIKKEPARKSLIKPRSSNTHEMTIRQLKETIEDIYLSKLKFDEKCREMRMPRETMDQFLYTYLNQKYGLKSLISEWSVLILRAIDKHESADAEVCLFSRVLSHRVDEDYRQVFEKLKENMKQFLKAKIQQANPYMREIQLNPILKEKINGVLTEDEWATIIVSMFSQEEAEFMIGNFKSILEENIGKLILARKTKFNAGKGEVSFAELTNFILNHDLSAREALLFPFYSAFTDEDFDKNGILNVEEFRLLCVKLGVDSDFARLLLQVDPFSSGFINFSDCVTLFTYEMVALENESPISVVHYLFFQSKSQ